MATERQIAANRRNARNSTGPTSLDGKSRSSANALKSCMHSEAALIPGESPEEFAQLVDEYYALHQPRTVAERYQVDRMARHDWLQNRFFRVESQLWAHHAAQSDPQSPVPLGEAADRANAQFQRLHRRVAHSEKSYQDAARQLDRLQSAPAPDSRPEPAPPPADAPDPRPQRVDPKPQTGKLASFRTFVRPTLRDLGMEDAENRANFPL